MEKVIKVEIIDDQNFPIVFSGIYMNNDILKILLLQDEEYDLSFLEKKEKEGLVFDRVKDSFKSLLKVYPFTDYGYKIEIFKKENKKDVVIPRKFLSDKISREIGTTDEITLFTWLEFELRR